MHPSCHFHGKSADDPAFLGLCAWEHRLTKMWRSCGGTGITSCYDSLRHDEHRDGVGRSGIFTVANCKMIPKFCNLRRFGGGNSNVFGIFTPTWGNDPI